MAKMATKANNSNEKGSSGRAFPALLRPLKWLGILLAGGCLVAVLVFSTIWLFSLNTDNVFPINRVELKGQTYTDVRELHGVLKEIEDRGFFTADMQLVAEKLESLAWVRNVQLRKIWPDTLQVTIQEHEPFAYWGNDGVVSVQGEVFYPNQLPEQAWVHLNGPDSLAKDLTGLLQMYQQQLQQKNLTIEQMQLSERGAIDLTLSGDVKVNLGKVHVEQRLERLIQYFDVLVAQKNAPLAYVDMRYENGLSVKWAEANNSNIN